MPLKEGFGQETISGNIEELMDTYRRTGSIGNIKPKNPAHAQQISVAIASKKADLGSVITKAASKRSPLTKKPRGKRGL